MSASVFKYLHISEETIADMSLVGTDFAYTHMEGLGWSKGKGLGKHHQGIVDAIKPKLKFDQTGVGHNRCVIFISFSMCPCEIIIALVFSELRSLSFIGGTTHSTRQRRTLQLVKILKEIFLLT